MHELSARECCRYSIQQLRVRVRERGEGKEVRRCSQEPALSDQAESLICTEAEEKRRDGALVKRNVTVLLQTHVKVESTGHACGNTPGKFGQFGRLPTPGCSRCW